MSEENNLQKEKSLNEKIIEVLSKRPGLKAREIANIIGVCKKDIGSVLYGEFKDECVQDEKYCWYLKKDSPKKDKEKEKIIPKTVLADLANYYLDCIGYDDDKGVSTFAESRYGLDYTELDSLPLNGNNVLFESEGAQRLFGKMRKDRGKLEMYFGYPTTLKKVKSKSGWEGFFVEPILLFPIEIDEGTPKISQGFPIFNLSVLKRFTNSEREQIIDELVELEGELGLNSEDEIPELDDLVRRLKSIRPEWPWKENVKPNNLPQNPSLKDMKEEGIYNRAILILGERSPYTQGLESELKSLSQLSPSDYEKTALGQWVRGKINKNEKDKNFPLLEVLPLNSEQRQAIQYSLTNSLTIITGPPGTGKSQVVTDLLINTAWRGKKVLFASKNNKAVDVVETRVNNLGARPILLRMGSQAYQSKLAEYLIGLLTSVSTENDQEDFAFEKQRYKELEKKFLEFDKQETELIRLRNETDELDQSIKKIRTDFSPEIFNELKKINTNQFKKFIQAFQKILKRVDKNQQSLLPKLFWNFIKKERYEEFQAEIKNIKKVISKLENKLPSGDVDNKFIKDWTEIAKNLDKYLYFAQEIQEYMESLKSLQKVKLLEDISREKVALMKEMANNAESLWKGWLRLQPSRLSDEDRQSLNKYNALLKMVIDAGGERLEGKIYREYSNISKKVSHLLPAWAITSLAARGKIPFEPGYFDIVVFDEASQCDIASALPLLYRAKQAVIIGDPKQLSHISNLRRGQDQQLLEKYNLIPEYVTWAYSYNSLFDLSSQLVLKNDIVNLRDHHRSHADIIEFSNQRFYGGNLRVATNYDNLKLLKWEKNGIRWVDVVGSVRKPSSGGAVNEIEAKAVVEEIRKIIIDNKYKGTIGVVTPFRAQANLINQIVNNDEELVTRLMNCDFLVEVVHKFQGDERDVMIFSPVVSKNMPSGALFFIKNNGNLFNVSITRARAMLLVVGDQKATINCKVSYLEDFAKYAQQIKNKKEKEIIHSVKKLGEKYPIVSDPEKVSEWEHILYEKLYKAGIKTIPQYPVEKYNLDLALFDGNRMLDIEVDGERYHRNWTGELCRRDQIRNQRLFELGWDVKRFWVYEIRDDIDNCVKRIEKWLKDKK